MTPQQKLSEKALNLKEPAQGGGEPVTTTLTGIRQVRASRKAKRRGGGQGAARTPPWRDRETVTVEEAAKILNISRNSAYAAVHSGELPGMWIRKRFLVSVPRLKRMIDGEATA
jgi:excisionase family DNA binding protein